MQGHYDLKGNNNDHYVKANNTSWALWFVVDIVTCIKTVSDVC